MQAQERVRTPPESDDRERLFVRPDATHDVEISESDDGLPEITVPISSTTEHRSGLHITEECLESMAAQLQDGTVGLWDDHGLDEMGWPEYRREDMYGWWVDGDVDEDVLYGTARLLPDDPRTESLLNQLEQGAPVGFSIGHRPTDEEWVEVEEGERREVRDTDLMETSPVGIPDNPDAYAEAGATARMIAHSVAEAGVPLDRETATIVADGIADALETMGDDTTTNDDESVESDDETDEETNDGEPSETNQDDLEELLSAFGDVVEDRLATHREEMRSMLEDVLGEGDDEDEEDDEEAAGDDEDEEDEEETNDVGAEVEELRAKLERLESEQRQSAGRKGIVTADDGEGDDEPDETNSDRPRDAFAAFQEE